MSEYTNMCVKECICMCLCACVWYVDKSASMSVSASANVSVLCVKAYINMSVDVRVSS